MGAVIDSSVFIAAERGKLDLSRVLADHGDEPVATRDERSFPRVPGLNVLRW